MDHSWLSSIHRRRESKHLAEALSPRAPPQIDQPGIKKVAFFGGVLHLDFAAPEQAGLVHATVDDPGTGSKTEAVILLDHIPSPGVDGIPAKCPSEGVDRLAGPRAKLARAVPDLT